MTSTQKVDSGACMHAVEASRSLCLLRARWERYSVVSTGHKARLHRRSHLQVDGAALAALQEQWKCVVDIDPRFARTCAV
jgi:hypothetical protein